MRVLRLITGLTFTRFGINDAKAELTTKHAESTRKIRTHVQNSRTNTVFGSFRVNFVDARHRIAFTESG